MISNKDNFLFLIAHPDDEAISCAGLMSKLLKQKKNVFLIVATHGGTLRSYEMQDAVYVLEDYCDHKLARFEHWSYEDTRVQNEQLSLKDKLERFIKEYHIEVSFSHCMDTNPDHCALKVSNEQAGRSISTFEFETPNAYNFIPSYFVSLNEDEVNLKLLMMRCHSSQNEKNSDFYLKKIKSTAEFRGLSIYEDFAEAYFPVRVRVSI